MRRIYTILHLYLMVAISLHLLWLISKTTKRPTTSEFLQLFRTSAKFFQSAFLAILYQAFRDAPHSLCLAVASLIAFRLTIRMTNLRILRSLSQAENDVPFGGLRSVMRSKRPPYSEMEFLLFRGARRSTTRGSKCKLVPLINCRGSLNRDISLGMERTSRKIGLNGCVALFCGAT